MIDNKENKQITDKELLEWLYADLDDIIDMTEGNINE